MSSPIPPIQSASTADYIYCDPPYIGRHTDYFNTWGEKDEQRLYEALKTTQARCMLSTWHSNQFRHNIALEKYTHGFTIFTREHFYHVGASEQNRKPMLEAIVLNYHTQQQHCSFLA